MNTRFSTVLSEIVALVGFTILNALNVPEVAEVRLKLETVLLVIFNVTGEPPSIITMRPVPANTLEAAGKEATFVTLFPFTFNVVGEPEFRMPFTAPDVAVG